MKTRRRDINNRQYRAGDLDALYDQFGRERTNPRVGWPGQGAPGVDLIRRYQRVRDELFGDVEPQRAVTMADWMKR